MRTDKVIFKMVNPAVAGRAGVVWANTYNKFDPTSPFGGYKKSGSRLGEASGAAWVGREGGLHGLAA